MTREQLQWILPLVLLLLERHLEIFKIGQTKILHPDELSTHSDSLYIAIDAFENRMKELKSIFFSKKNYLPRV